MTQEALANAMGIDRGTVISIEAGKTSFLVDQGIKASLHLKIPLSWLFSDNWTWPTGGGPGGGEWPDEPPPVRYP